MGPAQQALADGELSVFDTYETEYDLMRRKVLSWEGKNHTTKIPPGKKTTVVVNCLGKAGW
jgi:trafficking protein particle complex subunit 9